MTPDGKVGWQRVRNRIHSTQIAWSIGSDTAGVDVFGEVLAAEVDAAGRLVVLDGQNGTVKRFGGPGDLVDQFGYLRDGPASLRYARALGVERDGAIAVYLAPQRVKYFVNHDGEWRVKEAADLPVTVESTCVMDDGRVFVQGNPSHGFLGDDAGLFYLVPQRPAGSLRPFGKPYSGDWFAAAKLSLGLVVCLGALERVVFAHTILPFVQAFDSRTTDVLWRSRPGDHVQVPVTEYTSMGRVEYGWFAGDPLVTAVAITPRYMLLQYERTLSRNETIIRSYLLDSMTGLGGFVGERLPRIASFHTTGYIALFEDPFPRIEVHHFTQ